MMREDKFVMPCDEIDSDNEEDNVSVMSERSEYMISDSDDELSLENASLDKRLLKARETRRGRPATRLKGKNGYVWKMNFPARRSGKDLLRFRHM